MKNVVRIHERALAIAQQYKRVEVELIEILQLVGEHRVYYHYKYNSLFQYAVSALGLSENVAYTFIKVARKSAEVPALKNEIAVGAITVSKAKVICSVLTAENQDQWLQLAKTASKRQVEKRVASVSPKQSVPETAKYVSGNFLELRLGLPEDLMIKIRHAQDLVSQSRQQHVDLAQTLEVLVDFYVERKDPIKKATRQKARGKLVPGPVNVDGASARQPIPASVRHRVYLRTGGQCTQNDDNGVRCVVMPKPALCPLVSPS